MRQSQVELHLGHSDDSGATWVHDKIISAYGDVTVGLAAPNNAGTWINEVSSLLYDANAVSDSQWKLFWHHYLAINEVNSANDGRHFEHGWLAYKSAATPTALDVATEHKSNLGLSHFNSSQLISTLRRPALPQFPLQRLS